MKKLASVIAALLCAVLILCCAACGEPNNPQGNGTVKPAVTVADDGRLYVDGKPTKYTLSDYDKERDKGKAAFTLFKAEYPDYGESYEVWLKALKTNTLELNHVYDIIEDGELNAEILSGEWRSNGGASFARGLVAKARQTVVLPLFRKGSGFNIELYGTLVPDGKSAGGQLLCSDAENTEGRIYIGANLQNEFFYFGVCVSGVYINYGFTVAADILSSNHDYAISYSNDAQGFSLAVDGQTYAPDKMNISQGKKAENQSAEAINAELKRLLYAAAGGDYVTLDYIGSFSHKADFDITSLKVTTTDLFAYEKDNAHGLENSTLFFLGSSVTRGHGGNTDGYSFADSIAALAGAAVVKEAVSGTTLVDSDKDSYISRFKNFDFSLNPDALVLQLSTNDFSRGYGDAEIAAAIEKIAELTKNAAPDCTVYLYSCPLNKGHSLYSRYSKFVDYAKGELQEKCGYRFIDLFNANCADPQGAYMQSDGLHPTLEGYAALFTPLTVEALIGEDRGF